MKAMESSFRDKYSPKVLPIERIEDETSKIKSFYVNSTEIASESEPGQFLMLWVIGVDEIPMSMSTARDDGTLGLTVEKVGDATSRLHELQEGDLIGIRGPYGNGFDLSGDRLLLVCGGCGTAPLLFSAEEATKRGKDVTILLAAKTEDDLLFRSRMDDLEVDLIVATEDGSAGVEGLATDALDEIGQERDFDSSLVCGPERMMVETAKVLSERGITVQVSLNRYMKCGIGLCGQCSLDPSGLRVCKDGPVFRYEDVKDTEFGDHKRDSAGRRVEI